MVFAPFLFLILYFKIKLILILHKDNTSKYKMFLQKLVLQFCKNYLIY